MNILLRLIAAALLLGALGQHSYDYDSVLRWMVCGVAVVGVFQARDHGQVGWFWGFLVVAVVFNPMIPVPMEREIRVLIDVATAVFFVVSLGFTERDRGKK